MQTNLVLSQPNDRQKLFLKDRHKFVAFGGARGGGKSFAVRMKAVLLAAKHPGIKIMIIRRTYPELMANHIRPLRELCRCGTADAIARYNDSKKEMVFSNGSLILFGYCNSEADVDRYQGTEVDVEFVDEATMLSEDQIKKLTACVRGVNDFPKRIYYTCNPGGRSHAYIKRLFIDREYVEGEDKNDYSFIQSLVMDNKALMKADPDYVKQLEALPEKLKKAWLYGDWNTFVGQCFDLRNDSTHYQDGEFTHVINDFQIPKHWKVVMSMDWGYAKPFAFLWMAVEEDTNRIYVFREYYGCTSTPDEGIMMAPSAVVDAVRQIEEGDPNIKGHTIIRLGDPAIWGSQTGESVGQIFERAHIFIEKANNDRLLGKMQVHNRLAFDENNRPGLQIFKSCRHLIRTLPTLIYDEKRPEDVDTTGEDHLYDALRYALMRYTITPPKKVTKPPKPYDPLDPLDDYYKTKQLDRYDFYRRYN